MAKRMGWSGVRNVRVRGVGKLLAAVGVVSAIVAVSCGGGGSSCKPSVDLSGNWSGATSGDTIANGNPGVVNATFLQIGCSVSGTWTFDFQDSHLDSTRNVVGSPPEKDDVFLQFGTVVESCDLSSGTCSQVNGCIYDVVGKLVSPTQITGTYQTGQNCSQSQTGSFDIHFVSPLVPTPTPPIIVLPTIAVPTPTPTP